MKDFKILEKTKIKGLKVFLGEKKKDYRGFFQRVYCYKELSKFTKKKIAQSNLSFSKKKGTFRGMHFQVGKFSEDKIVTCIKGSILDIVLDVRKKNNFFSKKNVHTEILSEKNQKFILIPKGFAHGFQTLENNTLVLYFHTNFFSKKNQKMINIENLKSLIQLPLKISSISKRDKINEL